LAVGLSVFPPALVFGAVGPHLHSIPTANVSQPLAMIYDTIFELNWFSLFELVCSVGGAVVLPRLEVVLVLVGKTGPTKCQH
jgi:hypothetical protein